MRENWCWYDYQAGRAVENDVDGSEPDEEAFDLFEDECDDDTDCSTQEEGENDV